MPNIYLSPSTQEFNPYAGGGNEEYYESYRRRNGAVSCRKRYTVYTQYAGYDRGKLDSGVKRGEL